MPDHHSEHHPALDAGTSLDIRRRIIRVLAVIFVLLMGVAAIEGFWPGGPSRGLAIVFLALCAIVIPIVMARLAGPILRDVQRLEDERARLVDMYGRARQDSLVDALTGLGNHRAFQEELSRQLEQATRHGTTLALLLVDVDDLKKVNDERGHANGDELLAGLGRITTNAIRRGDRAFRVGGDEFAVILPERRHRDRARGRPTDARERPERRLRRRGTRRAVLALDRDLRVSRPEHPGQPALPPRRRRALLVQAARTDECGRLRPGPPRRLARRALHRGRLGGARARSSPSGRSDPSTSRSSR